MKLRVAGAQIPVGYDINTNVRTIERALDYAAEVEADLLLTPEGSLSGYTPHFDVAAVRDALAHVTALARERGVGLALGTCFTEDDGNCYNQVRFYTADGTYLGFHSKQLRCGSLETPPEGEINDYAATPLRLFDWRDLRLGALICNDLWANPECTPMPDPHLTQQLANMGAQVILHAVNGGRDGGSWSKVAWQYHEANLRMRARAGRVWVVTVDNCAPVTVPCSAPSGVIDPQGQWVVQAPVQGENYFVYTLNLGE